MRSRRLLVRVVGWLVVAGVLTAGPAATRTALASGGSRARAAVVPATPGSAPATPLTISPAPGTPDASPDTQISILGVAPARILSVSVTGSLSGRHSGRLSDYSGGRGASFVPARPLEAGERVAVAIAIAGARPISFAFTVAYRAPAVAELDIPGIQPDKLEHFVSAPNVLAPAVKVTKAAAGAGGDVFLAPIPAPVYHPGAGQTVSIASVGPGGPMIVDGQGRLVWFKPLPPPVYAMNLRPQWFEGRRVLTWWQGALTVEGFGRGVGVIADSSYRILHTVRAGNGYAADLHEFTLTASADALLTVYAPVDVRLAGQRAPTPVLDSIVQEVDVRTGLVVWEWHALGHIPLGDSYITQETSVDHDAFHLNSIQALSPARVLLSARYTSAVYLVDRPSGHIVWTLGGKRSTFQLGQGARFWFQHDAEMLAGNRIALFDDAAGPPSKEPSSRGIVLSLDTRRRTAALVRQFRRPRGAALADSQGSLQILANGDVFVGFGSLPFFSEFSGSGALVFDAQLPQDDDTYRAFRYDWTATPASAPSIAARRGRSGRVTVYASWNGATEIDRWELVAGPAADALRPQATVPATGFETRLDIGGQGDDGFYAVRALERSGRVLGTSAIVHAR